MLSTTTPSQTLTVDQIGKELRARIGQLEREAKAFPYPPLPASFMELLNKHLKTKFTTNSSFVTLWQNLLKRIHTDGDTLSQATKELLVTFRHLISSSEHKDNGLLNVFAGAIFNSLSSGFTKTRAHLITNVISRRTTDYNIDSIAKNAHCEYIELSESFRKSLEYFYDFLGVSEIDNNLFSVIKNLGASCEFKLEGESLKKATMLMECDTKEFINTLYNDPQIPDLMKDPKCKQSIEARYLSILKDKQVTCLSFTNISEKYNFSSNFYCQLLVEAHATLMDEIKIYNYDRIGSLSIFITNFLKTYPQTPIPFSEEIIYKPLNPHLEQLNKQIKEIIKSRSESILSKALDAQNNLIRKIKSITANPDDILSIFNSSQGKQDFSLSKMDPHNPFVVIWNKLIIRIKTDIKKDKRLSAETSEFLVTFLRLMRALQKKETDKAVAIVLAGISICKSSVMIGDGNRATMLQNLLKMMPAQKGLEAVVRSFCYSQRASTQSLLDHFDTFSSGMKQSPASDKFDALTKVNLDHEASVSISEEGYELKSISQQPLSTEIPSVAEIPPKISEEKKQSSIRDDKIKQLEAEAENELVNLHNVRGHLVSTSAITPKLAKHQQTKFSASSSFIVLWQDLLHRANKDLKSLALFPATKELLRTFKFLTQPCEPKQAVARLIACTQQNASSSLNLVNGQKRAKLILALIHVTASDYSSHHLASLLSSNYDTHTQRLQESLDQFKQLLERSPLDKDLFETLIAPNPKSFDLDDEFKKLDLDLKSRNVIARLLFCEDAVNFLELFNEKKDTFVNLMKHSCIQEQVEERLTNLLSKSCSPAVTGLAWKGLKEAVQIYNFSLQFCQNRFHDAYSTLICQTAFSSTHGYVTQTAINLLRKQDKLSFEFSVDLPQKDWNADERELASLIKAKRDERSKPWLDEFKNTHEQLRLKINGATCHNNRSLPDQLPEAKSLEEKMNPHNPFLPVWKYLLEKIQEAVKQKQGLSKTACEFLVILTESVKALKCGHTNNAIHVFLTGIYMFGKHSKRANSLMKLLSINDKSNTFSEIVKSFVNKQFETEKELEMHFKDFDSALKSSGTIVILDILSEMISKPQKPTLFANSNATELQDLSVRRLQR